MIVLKYTQGYNNKKSRFGTGFYLVVAVCLLIIGGASWFALSNMNNKPETQNKKIDEYQDKTSSYIKDKGEEIESKTESIISDTESIVSQITAEKVTEEPYTSEEAETTEEKETKNFSMPVEGEIIKEYSDSVLQYSKTYGDMRLHSGVDIACKEGTSVSACADGTVVSIGSDSFLGNVVVIDHKNGITVKYAALENLKVEQGSRIKCGDIIGTITTIPSECGDDSHLHIEVSKNGEVVSPLKALGFE